MARYLFKITRRVGIFFRGTLARVKLSAYRNLYKERFNVDHSVNFGKGFEIFFDDSQSTISIASNVVFRNYCELRAGSNGKLHIGNNNFFNNHCSIQCFAEISIGNNCQFGEATRMYDMNHRYQDTSKLISAQGYSTGKIIIGNNCWFGSNVTILKNVTIGDNVVIGANCLIHQSIPPNSLVIQEQSLIIRPIS